MLRRMLMMVLGGMMLGGIARADDRPPAHQPVLEETFEQYAVGTFPGRWEVRGDEAEARTIYRVAEEEAGNRFLRASAERQDIQIGLTKKFGPEQYPVLRWRWRVARLPTGGDERAKPTNDSAAAVYVVFDSRIIPRAIKYVWSTTLPVGSTFTSPNYWRGKVIVLQSGPPDSPAWRQETVNFYEDYKELFGFAPGEVQGVAILTDSDVTQSSAQADYDDLAVLPAAALDRRDTKATQVSALSVRERRPDGASGLTRYRNSGRGRPPQPHWRRGRNSSASLW